MSRLTLAKAVHRILRIDASLPGTAPTTTLAQTGVLAEIVDFVDSAYLAIQKLHSDWGFRLLQGTFNISNGTRTYTRATVQGTLTTFDEFVIPSGQGYRGYPIYLTATGVGDSSTCVYIPYQDWRGNYDYGTRATGKPAFFTVRQDQTIEFDPTPDATYTVAIDYRRTLHVFSADADETLWSDDFDDAVVYGAVLRYCRTRGGTQEMLSEYDPLYRNELARLRGRYRQELGFNPRVFWG